MIHAQKTSCLRVEQNEAFGGYPSMLTLPQGLSPAQMMSWGWGVLQGKVNDGQITNYGGPAPKGSSHTTGSALLSKPPAARKQWA